MGVKGGTWKLVLTSVVIAALAAGLPACGDGDGGTTAPSSAFEVPGGDNSVQRFGQEGSAAERRQASAAVEGYLDAVAAGEFAAQCEYLTRSSIEPLEQAATGSDSGACAQTLSQVRGGVAEAGFGAMAGPVGSLRVEGTQGFALYHGKGGVDYVLPLKLEGDEWKVASLVPVEL